MPAPEDFLKLLELTGLSRYEVIRETSERDFMKALFEANQRYGLVNRLPRPNYFTQLMSRAQDKHGSLLPLDLPGDNDLPGPDEDDDTIEFFFGTISQKKPESGT